MQLHAQEINEQQILLCHTPARDELSPKKCHGLSMQGTNTDRNFLLDVTRLGFAPKFAEGTAERCGEARGATGSHPAAAANRRDSASKGEIIGALHDPNSAMKLATGLDEMPGRRGIPEVN